MHKSCLPLFKVRLLSVSFEPVAQEPLMRWIPLDR